ERTPGDDNQDARTEGTAPAPLQDLVPAKAGNGAWTVSREERRVVRKRHGGSPSLGAMLPPAVRAALVQDRIGRAAASIKSLQSVKTSRTEFAVARPEAWRRASRRSTPFAKPQGVPH